MSNCYKNGDRYYGGLPQEPSFDEYAKFMEDYEKRFDRYIKDNDIIVEKDVTIPGEYGKYTKYVGMFNDHWFIYYEARDLVSTQVHKLFIDDKEVDLYKSYYDEHFYFIDHLSIWDMQFILEQGDKCQIIYKGE